MKIQKYKHDLDISYTLGITLTIELLERKGSNAEAILIHSSFYEGDGFNRIKMLAEKNGVPLEYNDKAFNILSQKENCYAIGVFRKFKTSLEYMKSHIVLVNPSNAGNMGTIIRTAAGFGIYNVAVIRPAVDIFDPKTVRAAMGALFSISFDYFDSFGEYSEKYKEREYHPFMLAAKATINDIEFIEPCSLVFGNEAAGLPEYFSSVGRSIVIPHSDIIDSLNLPVAAGIAMYEMTKTEWNK